MVIEGSEWGVFTTEAGNIIAEKLTRTDPAPEVLKKVLAD
jgi:hypothetical protein